MNQFEQKLLLNGKGVNWRKQCRCPECNKHAYYSSFNVKYSNIINPYEAFIYCAHCGYPHRELGVNSENPDKPQI